jgi:hypothetical protein
VADVPRRRAVVEYPEETREHWLRVGRASQSQSLRLRR